MSRWTMSAVALSLVALVASAQAQQAGVAEDALDGVDVVMLLQQGKEVFGKSAFKSTHGRFDYLFSSAETKAQFDAAPAKYAVQMNGLCARMAKTVQGNPSNYVVHDGRIYIFASDNCRKLFIEAPAKYLDRPSAPMPTSADAAAKGRALLDKAAAAHGGPRLDAVVHYTEKSSVVQRRPTGDVSIVTRNIWRFATDQPARAVRSERIIPLASGPLTVTTLLTPAGAWDLASDGRVRQVNTASVPALQLDLGRQLVPLLRTRNDDGVEIAALEAATIGAERLERVRMRRGGLDVILHIEPAGWRVRSISFTDRNGQGEVGDVTITFDDFRSVDGVTVPFAEKVAFNGTAEPAQAKTVDTAVLDGPIDPALFQSLGAKK
jgi:YHS domain-containing protein